MGKVRGLKNWGRAERTLARIKGAHLARKLQHVPLEDGHKRWRATIFVVFAAIFFLITVIGVADPLMIKSTIIYKVQLLLNGRLR
jgi:hypothetical protein